MTVPLPQSTKALAEQHKKAQREIHIYSLLLCTACKYEILQLRCAR